MRIVRVFPRRTSYTPDDDYVRFGFPDLITGVLPPHDEIHISITFTWDRDLGKELQSWWGGVTDKPVKLGGPAFGSPATDFIQGMYLKSNIIFTTRGCNNGCPWCVVPRLEGKLKKLDHIPVGNVIQDNNFLQADRAHKDKVFQMLKTQRGICFKGGLEPDLIDDHFVDNVRGLRIKELWLACDTDARFPAFERGVKKLTAAGFNQNKLFCYVLSMGKNMEADADRAARVYQAGAMPFMQLYQSFGNTKIEYPKEWKQFARNWSRPALIRHKMNG